MDKVSVEIDGLLADNLSKLAKDGAFGPLLVNCEFDVVIGFLLNKAAVAGQRILRIEAKLKEKEQLKTSLKAIGKIKNAETETREGGG
jgi:hypothetical protein